MRAWPCPWDYVPRDCLETALHARMALSPVDEEQGSRGSDVEGAHGFARRGSFGHVQPAGFGRVRGQRCEAAYFYQHGKTP